MDPASLDSQIMAHEGCDEMEDEGEKELPDLGLGANVVHDSDDEDNAVATMLAELPPPPTRPFWGGREYFAAARPLASFSISERSCSFSAFDSATSERSCRSTLSVSARPSRCEFASDASRAAASAADRMLAFSACSNAS